MTLRYISLNLNRNTFDNEYGYSFMLNTIFISNYFSKAIRKYKYDTDGSFNMISIDGEREDVEPKIVPLNVLKIGLKFDEEKYKKIKGTANCDYYLELLEAGFRKANKFKSIPLDILLNIMSEFKRNDCKNEWNHKMKKFSDQDLEVILTCRFTTNYFKLILTMKRISDKKLLLSGPVITTEPNEVLFDKMFKDVFIDKNKVVITDTSDAPRIVIDKTAALHGRLNFDITGPEPIRKMLSYNPPS